MSIIADNGHIHVDTMTEMDGFAIENALGGETIRLLRRYKEY